MPEELRSVSSLSRVWLFATPWTAACQASLSTTNSRSLFKLMSIELVIPSNHVILCRPLLLLPSVFPSIRVFSSESVLLIRWTKYWSCSFSVRPSNEYLGLISSRMDWLDVIEVQGTLKSLLQHHSSKASVLRRSAWGTGLNWMDWKKGSQVWETHSPAPNQGMDLETGSTVKARLLIRVFNQMSGGQALPGGYSQHTFPSSLIPLQVLTGWVLWGYTLHRCRPSLTR